MRRPNVWLGLAVIAATVLSGTVYAADPESSAEGAQAGEQTSQEAIQEYMARFATPGPEHKAMDFFKGEWKSTITLWMDPHGEPTKSEGTSRYEWTLDGRYLVGTYTGEFMGQPFQGMDITGFDRSSNEYFNVWLDTAGTGYLLSTGTMSQDGKALTLIGSMKEPMSGRMMQHRAVQTITGDDTFTLTTYQSLEDEPETKSMEIMYTRVTGKTASK